MIKEEIKAKLPISKIPFICPQKLIVSLEAKIATAIVPQIPFNKCTDNAPTGSSILNLSNIVTPITTIHPPIAPIKIGV